MKSVFLVLLLCVGPDLVPGQTEDDGGALAGPVDHQVQVRVVQVKYRAGRTRGIGQGDSGGKELQEQGDSGDRSSKGKGIEGERSCKGDT